MRHLLRAGVLAFVLTAPVISLAASGGSPAGTKISPPSVEQARGTHWANVPTASLSAGGIDFAYRELGKGHGGTPVVFLGHLAAVLDNWDPRVVDGLAAKHHVITFDNRGIGASGHPTARRQIR